MRVGALLRFLCASILLFGCEGFSVDIAKSDAPVVRIDIPANFYGRRFGARVDGFTGVLQEADPSRVPPVPEIRVSRLAVGGGAGSGYASVPVWGSGRLLLSSPLFVDCDQMGECSPGLGASLVGIPAWANTGAVGCDATATAGTYQRMCIVATSNLLGAAPDVPGIRVVCESRPFCSDERPAPRDVSFGSSAVALAPENPLGVALIGSKGEAGTGIVYRLPSGGFLQLLDLSAAGLGADAGLGSSVAARELTDGRTLMAAGAEGAERTVVTVLAFDEATDNVNETVLACLDASPGPVAIGNVTGDDTPDLLVSANVSADGAVETRIRVYDGAMLVGGTEAGCADSDTVDDPVSERELACAETPLVSCTEAAFGAALGTGNVDAQGHEEVFVGAPGARVDDKGSAGALFVFGNDGSGLSPVPIAVLTRSEPAIGDELGAAVTSVRTHLGTENERDEPVAGAPGAEAAFVFLCTGLSGDDFSLGPRCVVE